MEKERNNPIKLIDLLAIAGRYILLLLIGIWIYYSDLFYKAFFVLTAYPASFIMGFFYDTAVLGDAIHLNSEIIHIIPACVGVSAYFLLLMLNFATKMSLSKRVGSIVFSFFLLLAINIARIAIMSELFMRNLFYYDVLHMFTWYVLSILIVVGIWFLAAWIFKIKHIPAYSDFKIIVKSYSRIAKLKARKIYSSHHRLGYYYIKHQPHAKGFRRRKR